MENYQVVFLLIISVNCVYQMSSIACEYVMIMLQSSHSLRFLVTWKKNVQDTLSKLKNASFFNVYCLWYPASLAL